MSTLYSIILNFYTDVKTAALTWIEGAMCGGIMCGPVLGAVLYEIDGYEFMCFAFGGALMTSAIGISRLLPESLDMHTELEAEQEQRESVLTYNPTVETKSKWNMLLNPNFIFALITGGLGSFAVCFYYPMLPVLLMEKYGLS